MYLIRRERSQIVKENSKNCCYNIIKKPMDSKIIVKILIVGLTAVLAMTIFTEKDFLKDALANCINITI